MDNRGGEGVIVPLDHGGGKKVCVLKVSYIRYVWSLYMTSRDIKIVYGLYQNHSLMAR